MARVYLGLGSNIDKEKNLAKCIGVLRKKFKVVKISNVYETSPVGYKNQANFFNMAIEIETELEPEKLFSELMNIEKNLGRIREKRNHPRTIDTDILFYDGRIIKSDNLIVPHPRLHERAFVLLPLSEIAPDFMHPILKKSVKEMLQSAGKEGVLRKVK